MVVSEMSMISFCLSFSTKRLIVDVIRFQPGETLTEILDSTAGLEQVRNERTLKVLCFRTGHQ